MKAVGQLASLISIPALLAASALVTGCSSSTADAPAPDAMTMPTGGGDPIDPGAGTDAGTIDPGPAANCAAPATLGELAAPPAATITANNQQGGGVALTTGFLLDQTATPDVLLIGFWEGLGVFTNGFAPGTYDIAGAETDFAACGACIFVGADVDAQGNSAQLLMAQSGTLTITAIDPNPGQGRVTGSFSNVQLAEVEVSPDNVQTVVPNGCTSSLTTFNFDLAVQPPMNGAFAPITKSSSSLSISDDMPLQNQ